MLLEMKRFGKDSPQTTSRRCQSFSWRVQGYVDGSINVVGGRDLKGLFEFAVAWKDQRETAILEARLTFKIVC
jgi:hypothetical protein